MLGTVDAEFGSPTFLAATPLMTASTAATPATAADSAALRPPVTAYVAKNACTNVHAHRSPRSLKYCLLTEGLLMLVNVCPRLRTFGFPRTVTLGRKHFADFATLTRPGVSCRS